MFLYTNQTKKTLGWTKLKERQLRLIFQTISQMVNFMLKPRSWNRIKVGTTYRRNFSVALLNWERNRQEDKFSFNRFEVVALGNAKPGVFPGDL
jgi:hypothetical protein